MLFIQHSMLLKDVFTKNFHENVKFKDNRSSYFACKVFYHFEKGSRSGKDLKVNCVLISCNKRNLCIFLEELLALKVFMKGFTRRK